MDKEQLSMGKKYYTITYGCQMNESDTERINGQLEELGYRPAEEMEDADIVIMNTCSVRQNAEEKVYGKIGEIKKLKDKNPDMLLGIAGCMAQENKGKLIVALEGAWQPWSFHDESDTLVGYDVEVSRAIAEKLGVEPEYVESDWDSLFAGLDAGRYDIVCNGVEVTDERAKTYDFTEPYGYIHTALAVRKDNDEITSFEDLKGKTTANSLASTYMELAESYGATVQGIDTLEETIQLLTAGRIDATLNADVSFYDYLNVHPDADFKLVAQTEDASHVAIPLRKGDASATLLDAINTAIEELRADGTLKELSEKYFGQDISAEN